jgi:hypothetical protein
MVTERNGLFQTEVQPKKKNQKNLQRRKEKKKNPSGAISSLSDSVTHDSIRFNRILWLVLVHIWGIVDHTLLRPSIATIHKKILIKKAYAQAFEG